MLNFLVVVPSILLLTGTTIFFVTYLRVVGHERRAIRLSPKLMEEVDLIGVMGARANLDGPTPELQARLDHALKVWHCNSSAVIHVYGGIGEVDEAEAMFNYLCSMGVSASVITQSNLGSNTRRSIRHLACEVNQLNFKKIVLISSGYHAFRVSCEARVLKSDVVLMAPSDSPELSNPTSRRVRHVVEVLANIWYKLPESFTATTPTNSHSIRHRIPQLLIKRLSRKKYRL